MNRDLWCRAVAASGDHPWMILGEGTFHQVHGGVATHGPEAALDAMRAEYAAIHGHPFSPPKYEPHFVGALDMKRFDKGVAHPLDGLRQVQSVRARHFRVGLHTEALKGIQSGTLRMKYKGLRLAKSPFDLSLYMQAIERLRPATIIEIGTSEGGSALWLRDQCRAFGLEDTHVLSVDLNPPRLVEDGVSFHQGDSRAPDATFPTELISASPHPWLVTEDNAHTYQSAKAVLDYFRPKLEPGDMFVVEDGVLADLEGEVYRKLADGPNRAVAQFLKETGNDYLIDTAFCDFYGRNVTYSPNAWLRRR